MAKQRTLDAARTQLIAERMRETFGTETTTQTSERLGNVSNSSVNYWKTGINRPDYDTLIRICEMYNVSADWLLGRPGAPKCPEKGAEAACEFTGLSEEALRKMKDCKYRRELDYFVTDDKFEEFMKSLSRMAAVTYDLMFTDEEVKKIDEKDKYLVEKKVRYYDELNRVAERVELARFRMSESAVQSAESIFEISDKLKAAHRTLDQLQYEIEVLENRR